MAKTVKKTKIQGMEPVSALCYALAALMCAESEERGNGLKDPLKDPLNPFARRTK